MQTGQRWIVGLLLVIAALLGALVYLDIFKSDDGAAAENGIAAVNEVAPPANAAAAAPADAGDPIDAAVDNILAGDESAATEVKVTVVPRPFWGVWSQRAELCGKPESDDSAVEIGPRKLAFWESSGEVRSVVLKGPLEVEIAASFSGEGETWEGTGTYTLSPSRQDLVIASGNAKGLRYKRCS